MSRPSCPDASETRGPPTVDHPPQGKWVLLEPRNEAVLIYPCFPGAPNVEPGPRRSAGETSRKAVWYGQSPARHLVSVAAWGPPDGSRRGTVHRDSGTGVGNLVAPGPASIHRDDPEPVSGSQPRTAVRPQGARPDRGCGRSLCPHGADQLPGQGRGHSPRDRGERWSGGGWSSGGGPVAARPRPRAFGADVRLPEDPAPGTRRGGPPVQDRCQDAQLLRRPYDRVGLLPLGQLHPAGRDHHALRPPPHDAEGLQPHRAELRGQLLRAPWR